MVDVADETLVVNAQELAALIFVPDPMVQRSVFKSDAHSFVWHRSSWRVIPTAAVAVPGGGGPPITRPMSAGSFDKENEKYDAE